MIDDEMQVDTWNYWVKWVKTVQMTSLFARDKRINYLSYIPRASVKQQKKWEAEDNTLLLKLNLSRIGG